MTTPNIFALMGRLEELLQNEKRYLALRKRGVMDRKWDVEIYHREALDKFCDELIEEQGEAQG